MGLLDLLDGAKQALLAQRHLRVEVATRALSVSDELLIKAVERLANDHAPSAHVRLVAAPQGFLLTATVGAHEVQTVLELRGLAYAAGKLEVTLATHRAPRFEKRPFLNFLVAVIVKAAGGTTLAAKLFSKVLPPSLHWDGHTATITAKPGASAPEGLRLDASATRADGWTRLVLSSAEGLAALQSVLVQAALSSLGLAAEPVGKSNSPVG